MLQSCIDYCDNESVEETDMTEFLLKVCGHVQQVISPPTSTSLRLAIIGKRVFSWGKHSTMVIILASRPSYPGFDSQHSQKKFR